MECRFHDISSQVIYLSNGNQVTTERNSFVEIKSDGQGSSFSIHDCVRAEYNLTCFHHTNCGSSQGQTVYSGQKESQVFMENSISECPKAKEGSQSVTFFWGPYGNKAQIEIKQNNISHCILSGHTAIEFNWGCVAHCSKNTITKNEMDDVFWQSGTTNNEIIVERENIVENKKNSGSNALFYNGVYTVRSCAIISNNYTSLGSSFESNIFYGNTFSVLSEESSMPTTYQYKYITDWACVSIPETPGEKTETFSLPKKIKIKLKTQLVIAIYNSWKE